MLKHMILQLNNVKTILILLLTFLCSYRCCDYDFLTPVDDCEIRIVNMSDKKIYVNMGGLKNSSIIELNHYDKSLNYPHSFIIEPDVHDSWIILRFNNMNNSNWKECLGDEVDTVYIAIAENEEKLNQWMESHDPSLLLRYYIFTLDELGANKDRFTVYYF